jgi:hypothetical protein
VYTMSLTPVYFVYGPFTPPAGDIIPELQNCKTAKQFNIPL